jgi:hypothetical protein
MEVTYVVYQWNYVLLAMDDAFDESQIFSYATKSEPWFFCTW